MSKASERAQIDEKVLRHLRSIAGSTAWAMRGAVSEDRETISKALQRLKRKGLVECDGFYWQAPPEKLDLVATVNGTVIEPSDWPPSVERPM